MREVDVYMNETKAGVLTEEIPGYGYTFVYDVEYVGGAMLPVSVNLPKRLEPYWSEHLFAVFSNMVPEGSNRRIICRSNRLDEKDIFGLLCAMADCDFIGAVNVRNARV